MFKISSFPKKKLKWWRENEASIDFNPNFQRTSRVWKDKDKAFLIDSILNGFDIPKIYIADFTKHNIPALNLWKAIRRPCAATAATIAPTANRSASAL